VYAGSTPETIDRAQPLATAADTDHIIIDSVPHQPRPYFEVALDDRPALIVAERSLPLQGIANARDIGGYPAQDGQHVRWGQVYRTGSLAGAADDDLVYLQHLGVKLICDLRSEDERAEDMDRLPQNPMPEYRHLPVTAGEQTGERLRALLFNPRNLQVLMDEAYTRYMVEQNGPVYGEILCALADPANLPAIIHCTAGKDRTGITIALLLAVLGVSDEVIIADYSLSNRYYPVFRRFIAGKFKQPQTFLFDLNIDDFQPLLTAPPKTLRLTLDYIREHYGSIEGYLEQKAGVDSEMIAALKANLLA
jgi:protein-tyrosine phosphatase